MLILNSYRSGLIYSNEFTDTTLDNAWTVSPNNYERYSLTDRVSYLRLKHGLAPVYLLQNIPTGDYVFECSIDYNPTNSDDRGGLVLFRNETQKAGLFKYYQDDNNANWKYLRLVRKGDVYEGYASLDGQEWTLYGSILDFGAQKVGFVLEGTDTVNTQPLDIKSVKIYRSNKIFLHNLEPGVQCELYDEEGNRLSYSVVEKAKACGELDVSHLSFPLSGYFKLLASDGTLLQQTDLFEDLCGGDAFWYGSPFIISIDDNAIKLDGENYLGHFTSDKILMRANLYNSSVQTANNVHIFIRSHQNRFGWTWVKLAKNINGAPGEFADRISYDVVPGKTTADFWIEIIRSETDITAGMDKGYFEIITSSEEI